MITQNEQDKSVGSVQRNEKRFTIILIILAIIGVILFSYRIINDIQSGIGLTGPIISKEEAINKSKQFLTSNNFNIEGYDSSLNLYSHDNAEAFLQRNLADGQGQDYLKENNLSTKSYTARFFKDSEINEFSVDIDVKSGNLVTFVNTIPENENRPELDKENAKVIVNNFLNSLNYNLDNFEERDYSTNKVQNRVDHTFRFKLKDSKIDSKYGEAYPVIRVDVQGDRIGLFNYYLFVPEEFEREINQSLSAGSLLTILSTLATVFIIILAFIFLVKAFINKKANWKPYLYLSLLTFVIILISQLNDYNVLKSVYTTDIPFAVYIAIGLIGAILLTIILASPIFIAGVAGEYVSNLVWKDKFTSSFKNIPKAILRGYLIAFASFSYISLIYLIGVKYLGLWSMSMFSINYSFLVSFIPILSATVILAVIWAPFAEEIVFRLFGISIFKKYFKSTLVAVIIAALIWAVAHSDYPVFPFYFRAIELLIGGIFWGYLFIRYGLSTLIASHYVYNASIMAISMILIGKPVFIISGVVLFLFPIFLIPIINLIKKKE